MACDLRIGEDDGGLVVDVGVDVGLEVLGDGGDGVGAAAVHQPGHQVGAVAAEVEEGAATVEFGIVEPGEELRLDVDLRGALVAVVDDYLANFADGVLVDEVVGSVIAAVPGGLVVDEDGDLGGVGGSFDGAGIFVADGQRLFHHYRDVVLSTNFYRATMVEGVGVDEDGLRVRGGERFIEVGVP